MIPFLLVGFVIVTLLMLTFDIPENPIPEPWIGEIDVYYDDPEWFICWLNGCGRGAAILPLPAFGRPPFYTLPLTENFRNTWFSWRVFGW
jgi:hypothetical protein